MSGKRKMAQAPVAPEEAAKTSLESLAKEINVRFEKASKLEHDADDHRLAAALQLAEAKKQCVPAKITFKAWCEANIVEQRYEHLNALALVGASENPAVALADMRRGSKERMKKSRAAKAPAIAQRDATKAPTAFTVADQALEQLGDTGVELLKSHASKHGLAVVSENEAKAIGSTGIEAAKFAFESLPPASKIVFLEWAAESVGCTILNPFVEPAKSDELPAFLKRVKDAKTVESV